MKCPACEETIESIKAGRAPTVTDELGTLKCVAYCCPKCDAVLGVESHPLVRDEQNKQTREAVEKLKIEVTELMNRVKGWSLVKGQIVE